MDNVIYLTNSIQSFNIEKDYLVETYVYVPERHQKEKTLFGSKIYTVGGGWIKKKIANGNLRNILDPDIIKEDKYCYDYNKLKLFHNDISSVTNCNYKCFFSYSKFISWFENRYENGTHYYKCHSTLDGRITEIDIYRKGNVRLDIRANVSRTFYYKILKEAIPLYTKQIAECIKEYPFFRNDNGSLVFLKLDDDNNMKYII